MKITIRTVLFVMLGVGLVWAGGGRALADANATDFENFTLGDLNGQNGWASGHGSSFCPVYDVAVVANTYGYPSFGSKSLRISNAITCGSFNDQTFSASLANEAGETSAGTSAFSGGTRQPYFEAQWDFASTVPGSAQPDLSVVASANRGDTMRMTWLQMLDTPDASTGLTLNFEDYQHSIMNFVTTPVATHLDRTVPHTVKMKINFIDGPSNDVVRVYLDGTLVHTGTTWEDYYRDFAGGIPFPVDSIMFREAGTAVPAVLGNGFLIDNFSSFSGQEPATLTVVKTVTNNNGGIKAVSDFPLFINGTSVTSGSANPLAPGPYTVSETSDPGYAAAIGGDCAADGTITLAPGDDKTCTITNDDIPAHLIVIKHVVNDNGGVASASDFATTISGVTTAVPTAAGVESPGVDNVLTSVGSYSVDEGAHVGYDAIRSADCSGTIAPGETKTCTITDDDIAAHLIVIKHVVNNSGGNASASAFATTIYGVTTAVPTAAGAEAPGVSNVLASVGSYSIDEGAHVGYDSTLSADCSGTIASGETKTCTIVNDDMAAPDTTPPAAITDLALSGATASSLALTWTAPGDDGIVGTATMYNIRYSASPITDVNFAAATGVMGEPIPAVAGTVQHMTVTGLASGTLYYFAMKTRDGVPNFSLISNVAHLSTLAGGGGGGGSGGVSSPPSSAPPPVPAPTPTPLSTGNYSANEALNASPTIAIDKGLTAFPAGSLAPCAAGSLVKIADDQNSLTQSDSSVYYCGEDGRRYVFPGAPTFFSWYSNFNDVQIISAQAMAGIPLGLNNVTIRPGASLVKFSTDAKVYAVSPSGILRWVVDEPTAAALYGPNWNKMVIDIPDTLLVNYRFGGDITLSRVTPGSVPPAGAPVVPPVSAPVAAACSTPAAFTRSLALGASGTEVLALQNLLQCLGDFPATIAPNGNFGPATEQAVKQFQTANGLAPVGYAGPETREALNRHVASVVSPVAAACSIIVPYTQPLTIGASGADVLVLQKLLQCLGDFPANVAPNGNFGPATEQAVKRFQTANGLAPVGYVGPETWEALNGDNYE